MPLTSRLPWPYLRKTVPSNLRSRNRLWGTNKILAYMRAECYGLRLMPEQGVAEPAEGDFTQIKVDGESANTVVRRSGRHQPGLAVFLLNPQGQIFFVGIDVLASAKELLNLGLVR